MRHVLLWLAGPLCVLAAFAVAWLFELSTERVLLLAPVIVIGTAAVLGLVLLWVRAARESVRRNKPDDEPTPRWPGPGP